jgi:hypothetical protein
MPLMVTQASAGSIPGGGGLMSNGADAVDASAVTPDGTQQTAGQPQGGSGQWMPVFQIGLGENGVPTTARGLISGFQPGATVATKTANSAATATQAALAANTPAGASTGQASTSGGAASSSGVGAPAKGGAESQDPATRAYEQQQKAAGQGIPGT